MNDFKGISRDTGLAKAPEGMWSKARNIILSRQYLSVSNEQGSEYLHSIPGIYLGAIVSNQYIVYFSKDNEYTCIGYVKEEDNIYVPVLRTTNPNFKFEYDCPVEGVYLYNYKKEFIVMFSNGINIKSSTPKLINITKPQVALSATNDFVNAEDYAMFELFNHNTLPEVKYEYQQGSLDAEIVHMAISYIYEDNTDGLYSPILETVYPNFKGHNTIRRNVKFTLSNLSPLFKKIKLAFIVKKEAGVFAYTTAILTIKNNKIEYTLSSEEDLSIATPEEIVIQTERFTKIRTITKTANQIEVANVQKEENFDFQKYANRLRLNLKLINSAADIEKYKSNPTFLPDEVYNISIVPILKDGTKTNAFHIPGRTPRGNENTVIPNDDFVTYGLNFDKLKNKNYKYFHLLNTGSVINPSTCDWAYWENEDTYPDKDYYNSISVGGPDLRNTPIRFHRFPSIDKVPNNLGIKTRVKIKDTIDDELGYMPRFYFDVANFDQVVPADIKAKLQGYEIVFEKRSKGGTYIETNGLLYRSKIESKVDFRIALENGSISGELQDTSNPSDFTICNYLSVETAKDKIDITADIVKLYTTIGQGKPINDGNDKIWAISPFPVVTPTFFADYERMALITDAKYLLADNISSNNRYGEEKLQLTLEHLGLYGDTSTEFIPLAVSNTGTNFIHSSLINLNKNIYNLENNNDFISVGIVKFETVNNKLVNGDVFLNNIIKKTISSSHTVPVTEKDIIGVYAFINYYIYNIYSPLSNNYVINGKANKKRTSITVTANPSIFQPITIGTSANYYRDWITQDVNILNSEDYSTTVKSKDVKSYFNDYGGVLPYALTLNYINYFPYRIYKGLAIANESLQTNNLRFFPTNSYYDMRNDRGEVIAIRGFNNGLYIQQRHSVSTTTISDKLETNGEDTYLGNTQLFDRLPEELLYNDNIGYVGSNSQFACMVFKDGYVTVDEEQGKVFIINDKVQEISKQFVQQDFREVLPIPATYKQTNILGEEEKIDNPFVNVGYVVGYDNLYNRLLITKKYYEPTQLLIDSSGEFNGSFYKIENQIIDYENPLYFKNKSVTLSYALDSNTWVAEHDYQPNDYIINNKGLKYINNSYNNKGRVIKHSSDNVNPGNYDGVQYEAYVDLIFNTRLDLAKQYQAIEWITECFDMTTGKALQFDTIDKVMLYHHYQCSGYIEVGNNTMVTSRNVEGKWKFNEFRDLLKSPDTIFLDEDGKLIENAIVKKSWFNKNIFINNFIVVRVVYDNKTKVIKHLQNINVKSVMSKR